MLLSFKDRPGSRGSFTCDICHVTSPIASFGQKRHPGWCSTVQAAARNKPVSERAGYIAERLSKREREKYWIANS